MIAKTKHKGVWYYNWNDIHAALCEVYPCATELLVDQYEGTLDQWVVGEHHWITRDELVSKK